MNCNNKEMSQTDNSYNWTKHTWKVIEKYLKRDSGNHLVHHQIHSYN